MTNDWIPFDHGAPLPAKSAFVVHLAADVGLAPEAMHGRIEHVVSGRAIRFASAADLIGFMQQTLAQDA